MLFNFLVVALKHSVYCVAIFWRHNSFIFLIILTERDIVQLVGTRFGLMLTQE